MSAPPPIPMRWMGDGFHPLSARYAQEADARFVVGQVYPVAVVEQRSEASHAHEFAFVKEAWRNLPEHLADEYPSPDHLRKRALVQAGFYDETIIDAGTNAAAIRVAAAIRTLPGEEFSVVFVRGPVVVRRAPKSQSRRAMDKHEFQASKNALIEVIAEMLAVKPDDLRRARAA